MAEIPQTPAAAVGPLRRLLALACLAALAAGGAVAILGGAAAGALAAALACAVVVAVAGNLLLVRPMLRLAGSGHEVARTGQAMAGVAHDLRLAEWRQARLGAIAMGAGKVSHDLRGTLAPALLAAERLQLHSEPSVKRAGDILVRAVERATDLVRSGLDGAREGHESSPSTQFMLCDAVAEAVAAARAAMSGVTIEAAPDATIELLAIRENVVRSLSYLLQNCGAAPGTMIVVTAERTGGEAAMVVTVGGPGLADTVAAAPFQPFGNAAGLNLAIARDLARANAGGLVLERTGPQGSVFRLSYPTPALRPAARDAAAKPPAVRPVDP